MSTMQTAPIAQLPSVIAARTTDEATWSSPGYRPSSTRAAWAKGLFIVAGVVAGIEAMVYLGFVGRLDRYLAIDPYLANAANRGALDAAGTVADGAEVLSLVVGLALAVAFLAWLSRVVEDIPPLGAGTPHTSPRWAIVWWFVPIAFLWKPYIVVRDVWARLNITWPATGMLAAWWSTWIGGTIAARVAALAMRSTSSYADFHVFVYVEIGGLIALVGAAVTGFVIVREVQRRVEARAERLGFQPPYPTFGRVDKPLDSVTDH